jgi:pyruvate,orthophosphate dikinase
MFFQGTRIQAVREMILADDAAARAAALAKLLPLQREDFVGIFRAMAGSPSRSHARPALARVPAPLGAEERTWPGSWASTSASSGPRSAAARGNPMLGFRGCRLGILPRDHRDAGAGDLRAACRVAREGGAVRPEVMIPLVSTPESCGSSGRSWTRRRPEVFAASGDGGARTWSGP